MNDFEESPSPADDFEVEVSMIDAERDTAPAAQTLPASNITPQKRARRLLLGTGALLAAFLIFASTPALRNQALSLFGSAATPAPASGSFSYAPLTPQPIPDAGWALTGPRNARQIVFSPSAPETAYTCGPQQPSGDQPAPLIVGISHDAGQTWGTVLTPAIGAFCNLTVNPTNPQDVLLIVSADLCASPSKLYRTFDGGAHWNLWSLPPSGPSQSSALLCAQWVWVGSTLVLAPILSLDPTYRRLAASIAGQAFTWLNLQSLFAGVHSDPTISELLATSSALYALVGSQTDAANCCWFMQSRDDGASWVPFNPQLHGKPIFYLLGTGADGRSLMGEVVYGGDDPTNRDYLRSTDGGATWSVLPPHPSGLVAGLVTVTPDGTVYAAFDKKLTNTGTEAPYGIYKATPGALAWTYVAPEPAGAWLVSWDEAGHPAALWGSIDTINMPPAIERHQP